MEVALCVVQTGNEMARVLMLEKRLAKDNSNRAIILMIAKSRASADLSEQKVLNNLLTTFYIKPADVDQEGSIEFAHKSFGEFLFAERLKEAIEDWSKLGERRRGSYLVSDEELHWEIYDLLGYGGLTPEVMDYLMVMLQNGQEWDPIILFERLNQFWESWYSGEFIDAPLGNLPQKKARLLREQMPDRENKLGLRQVDVYGGLNILILLLWLHRYAQNHSELKREIDFHLNGKSACGSNPHPERLLKVIHYANCLETSNFSSIVGFYLSRANLSRTDLRGANLSCADLSYASLSEVDLRGANLRGANFSRANLSDANLSRVYLRGADLRGANLSRIYFRGANLREADLCNTTLPGADLRGVNLRDAKVCNADLSGASLRGAYLRSADLSGADLSGANLRGVYLSGANLRGVYLIGADLSRADLNNLIYDQSTRWEQVKGLETATNIPDRLKQQLNLP